MKLVDLHPEWEIGPNTQKYLVFDCPKCQPLGDCLIMIPRSPNVTPGWTSWEMQGEAFDTLTVSPSIFHHCKSEAHFFIRNGNIDIC